MQKLERVCYLDLEEKRVMLTALRLACCSCRMFLLIWKFDFGCSCFFMCWSSICLRTNIFFLPLVVIPFEIALLIWSLVELVQVHHIFYQFFLNLLSVFALLLRSPPVEFVQEGIRRSDLCLDMRILGRGGRPEVEVKFWGKLFLFQHLFRGADEWEEVVEGFREGKGDESGPKSIVEERTNSCW